MASRKTVILQDEAAAAADGVAVDVSEFSLVTLQLLGSTYTGSVFFEVRHEMDDTPTWVPIAGLDLSDHSSWATSVANPSSKGIYIPVVGWKYFRARVTRTGGTISVFGSFSRMTGVF